MHNVIVSNIEKLGFNVRDIKIMVSSRAHWDHVETIGDIKPGDSGDG